MNDLVNVSELSLKQFEELEKQIMARRLGELTNKISITEEKVEILKEEVEITNNKVNHLTLNMIADSKAISKVLAAGRLKVAEVLGGKESIAYEHLSKKVFANFWKYYCYRMEISVYRDTPVSRLSEALQFIDEWKPKKELQEEINKLNGTQFDEQIEMFQDATYSIA